jgi:uncharacterized protein (TIGR01370 family)
MPSDCHPEMPQHPRRRPLWALIVLGGGIAAVVGLAGCQTTLRNATSWAVYYGQHEPVAALQVPDVLVLEPDRTWPVKTMRRDGQTILAYLSLGEVNISRPYAQALSRVPGATTANNPDWPGAMTVDPRSPVWRRLLLEEVAPAILAKGYDGFFLDTLDSAVELERQGKHPGAGAAMADLVAALKTRFPAALLVANNGYPLLPRIHRYLAGLATESMVTDYQFRTKAYGWKKPSAAAPNQARWARAKAQFGLPVFVIEYVKPDDAASRAEAAGRIRQAGFVPFVADIGLNTLWAAP